jgi:hypothetical protein
MEDKKVNYEITDKMIDESITQEIYLQAGFKTSICILILNTGAEVVGTYAPVEAESVDVTVGKGHARTKALALARTQIEAISSWRQALNSIKEQQAAQQAAQEAQAAQQQADEEAKPGPKKPRSKVRPLK